MGLIGLVYSEVRKAASDIGVTYSLGNKRKIQAMEREILKSVNASDT